MSKYEIQVSSEKCTGCLGCSLACSERYTGAFNPRAARVRVEFTGLNASIAFDEQCNCCGTCADHCLYGALAKAPKEERP